MTDERDATSDDVSGESENRGAEEVAHEDDDPGRETLGTKGASDRPYGESTPRDATGVDPQGPIDPESPYLPPT